MIVGQNGWRTEELLPELAAVEASGTRRWLKYVPRADIFAILQSAQGLVFPSLYEGFGLPVLEGFASRIPVITSNTTSLPEVAGDAATLVDPESVEQIAWAMRQCAEDQAGREARIQKGLDQARRFTWQATASRTLAAYHAALG
ncbi:glycosyltransferase family 1 protein [Ramlibacter sp. 2FC]|uniref:glycosyltransferase family 4 protein n=1 Tax=Ramlibacter sp. 2FC TaxID=2502188 RepID=UPI001BB2C68B|nr:glycosyltransferase family 1 protein [Ramlibacter sp. 2FC]